jgi:biotin operon repressor
VKEGVAGLTREIMTIQAEGDYVKAKALGDRLGIVRPEVQKALDKLESIPVDIEPRFISADQLVTRMR